MNDAFGQNDAHAAAAFAGLHLDVTGGGSHELWRLFRRSELLLSWRPKERRACTPDASPSVQCGSWREAIDLALATTHDG